MENWDLPIFEKQNFILSINLLLYETYKIKINIYIKIYKKKHT